MIVTAFKYMELNNLEDEQIFFFKQADVCIPYSAQNLPFNNPQQQEVWFGICLPLSSSLERSGYLFTNILLC